MYVSQLYIYPVKSLRGIAVQEWTPEQRGFRTDRRWMLVDHNGRFLSQRTVPQMTLLQPEFVGNTIRIYHLQRPEDAIVFPIHLNPLSERQVVEIWDDRCEAIPVDANVDKWFSRQLNIYCKLVYLPDDSLRIVPYEDRAAGTVSFADAYPYLFVGAATLQDLNERLSQPVEMERFRPNIVFVGGQPYEEDHWINFRIGDHHFFGAGPCARCAVPTIDPNTALKGKEPTATLNTYRKAGNKVYFGLNAGWQGTDGSISIKIGDILTTI